MGLNPVLLAESIGKTFGTRRVLSAARLEATSGSVTLVAGRNGSGKTTLLRIVSGMLAADSGFVRFVGQTFERPKLHRLAQLGLFYLPDRDLLAPFVPLRSQLNAIARRFDSGVLQQIAEQLGVEGLLDYLPRDFSGGEQRRSELAAAWLRRPICLIADEPLRGIDPKDTTVILDFLRTLAAGGCAVVISGHDIAPLMEVTTHVVWITAGTTYVLGDPTRAANNEHFRKDYLTGRWD